MINFEFTRTPLRFRHLTLIVSSILGFSQFTAVLSLKAQSFQWHRALTGHFHAIAFNPLSHGRILFAGPYDSTGVYRSDDGGATWKRYVQGLGQFTSDDFHEILCIPSDTSVLLAVSTTALYRSSDGGMIWQAVEGLGGINGEGIAYQSVSDAIYYGKYYAGPTLKSVDHGINWVQTGAPDTAIGLCTIAVSPDNPLVLLAGSGNGVIARSTNEGTNWQQTLNKDTGSAAVEVPKIVYSDYATNALFEHHFAIATRWISDGRGIVTTSNAGSSWSTIPFPHNTAWALDVDQRRAMLTPDNSRPRHFWIGLFRDRSDTLANSLVPETTDGGQTWHSTNFPKGSATDPLNPITEDVWVLKFDTTSRTLAAATGTGIYLGQSTDGVAEAVVPTTITCTFRDGALRLSSAETIASFEIYDEIGRRVMHRTVQRNAYTSGILSYPHGSYIVRVVLANGNVGSFRIEI